MIRINNIKIAKKVNIRLARRIRVKERKDIRDGRENKEKKY